MHFFYVYFLGQDMYNIYSLFHIPFRKFSTSWLIRKFSWRGWIKLMCYMCRIRDKNGIQCKMINFFMGFFKILMFFFLFSSLFVEFRDLRYFIHWLIVLKKIQGLPADLKKSGVVGTDLFKSFLDYRKILQIAVESWKNEKNM